MIVFENEYFALIDEKNTLLIKTKKLGFEMKEFNKVTLDNPTFHITNFTALKTALMTTGDQAVIVGVVKPSIDIHISADKMEARVILNISAKSLEENKVSYTSRILEELAKCQVIHGIENIEAKPISVQREILVAKGTPAIDGADSEIKIYEMKDKKPKIEEDGKVNHYELSLIESVSKGDWVGEMTQPTLGTAGKTVTGEIIEPKPGKTKKLLYDSKTVATYEESGKFVMRALVDGAIRIDNGKVKIDNLLIIKGDVDYVTGNVHFAGSVTVQGTVQDNFSVIANGDISINSPLGVGSVNRIESIYGSIYIKGGIYGKYVAKVKADKDIFIKYCNETDVVAKGNINIGFYSLNSNLTAQNVLLDPTHGKIIGGNVYAEAHVVAGFVGNLSEKVTFINISGFDREKVSQSLGHLVEEYKNFRLATAQVRQKLDAMEKVLAGTNMSDNKEYAGLKELYETNIRELIKMESEQKKMLQILSTKGEGELNVFKTIFPKTHIMIKHLNMVFDQESSGTIYLKNGELIQE